MRRGYLFTGDRPAGVLKISTRQQRLLAIKTIVAHLERIRDTERRNMNAAACATSWRYEAELITSIIDDAILILDTLH